MLLENNLEYFRNKIHQEINEFCQFKKVTKFGEILKPCRFLVKFITF